MGAIQGSINSVIGTAAVGIAGAKSMIKIAQNLPQQSTKLKEKAFNAEEKLSKAEKHYKKVSIISENIDTSGKMPRDKKTGKFVSKKTVGQVTHDVDKAKKALQIASENVYSINIQRQRLSLQAKKFGVKIND